MTDLWYPDAVLMPAPTSMWGTFTGGKPKFVVHTTEGPKGVVQVNGGLYFGKSGTMPSATLAIVGGRWRICQHIPNNRSSCALRNLSGGVQTNRLNVVQVEIAWTSADIASLPDEAFRVLADYLKWDSSVRGTPLVAPFPFKAAGAGQHRCSAAEWTSAAGVLGHQHVTENDHTDPGAFDVAKLLRLAGTTTGTTTPEDDLLNVVTVNATDIKHRGAIAAIKALALVINPKADLSTPAKLDAAIRFFQGVNGLEVDGWVGPKTATKLAESAWAS